MGHETVFDFDAFLSHSSDDKETVRELVKRLKARGLRIWLDEEQIQVGDSIPLKVNEGLKRSKNLLMAWSENFANSEWAEFESNTFRFRDPNNKGGRRFVPIRLDDFPVDETLAQFKYVDWRSQADDALDPLIKVCRPAHVSGNDTQPQADPTVDDSGTAENEPSETAGTPRSPEATLTTESVKARPTVEAPQSRLPVPWLRSIGLKATE